MTGPLGPSCHGLWVENVQLFILCTQFVNVSSVLNKQAALLREGCPFQQPGFLAVDQGVTQEEEGQGGPVWKDLDLSTFAMPEDRVQVRLDLSPPPVARRTDEITQEYRVWRLYWIKREVACG